MALNIEEIEKRIHDSYELPNRVLDTIPEPMVTVRTSTYQHAPYIRDCIEAVLMQKTTFPVEYIIGEDFSTDGTREIVFEYAKKYPEKIRVFTADYNVGAKANGTRCRKASRGKYMAICEGDDYWIDPSKLQKQVDFLEDNEEYGMIYSKAKVFNDKKKVIEKDIIGKDFNNKDLLLSNSIPTLTTMFRTNLYQRYIIDVEPEKKNWKMGDYPVWLWFQFNSKIYFMPEITAVYRLLTESASNSSDKSKRFQFKLSGFDIADYFATTYCNDVEYVIFLENRYLFLYLFGVKHNIQNKNGYIKRLRELKKLNRKTKIIIGIFYDLKFAHLFYLIFRNRIFRRLLLNWWPKIFSGFGY